MKKKRRSTIQKTTDKKQNNKRQKNKKAQSTISENCWLEVIWKKEKKKKKWEKKWDYIDEKMSDWNAGRKVGGWSAKPYGAARGDRKNVVPVRGNWLRAAGLYDETTRDWLRAAVLYDFDTSMMKNLMMNLIIWLMIVSDLIVDDIRRWYDYLDDAVDAIICCDERKHVWCIQYISRMLLSMSLRLTIYTI